MTNAQAEHPSSDDGKDESTHPSGSNSEPPKAAPPEPMTPARVFEWNSYYDLYVAAGVLLLAFLSSANRLQPENSVLWSYLHAGRQISDAGRPVVSDVTSIAGQDHRWVNIPWLFEWTHYQIYTTISRLLPPDPSPEMVSKIGRGASGGIGALIALSALVRALTAYLLLGLRRPGPGLWWVSICVVLALGVFIVPIEIISFVPGDEGTSRTLRTIGVQLGGLARPAMVSPATWGLLLFAGELLILHRAARSERPWSPYLLIPLFLLWANLDDSFGFGLLVLAGAGTGVGLRCRQIEGSRPSAHSDGTHGPCGERVGCPDQPVSRLRICCELRDRPEQVRDRPGPTTSFALQRGSQSEAEPDLLRRSARDRPALLRDQSPQFPHDTAPRLPGRDLDVGRVSLLLAVLRGRPGRDARDQWPGMVSGHVRGGRQGRHGVEGLVDRRSPGHDQPDLHRDHPGADGGGVARPTRPSMDSGSTPTTSLSRWRRPSNRPRSRGGS